MVGDGVRVGDDVPGPVVYQGGGGEGVQVRPDEDPVPQQEARALRVAEVVTVEVAVILAAPLGQRHQRPVETPARTRGLGLKLRRDVGTLRRQPRHGGGVREEDDIQRMVRGRPVRDV